MQQELMTEQGILPFTRRRWRPMMIAFTVVLVAGLISLPFIPKKYQSSAKLIVMRAEQRTGGVRMLDNDLPELTGASHPLLTQSEMFRLRPVVQDAIQDGELKDEHGKPLSVDAFQASLRVYPIKSTDLMEVRLTSSRPEQAHRMLTALCTSYLKHIQQYRKEGVQEGLNYLEEQLTLAKKALADSEERLQRFKRVSGTISLPSEIEASVREYSENNSLIRARQLDLESAQAKANGLRAKLGMSPRDALDMAAIVQNPRLKFLQDQLMAEETAPVTTKGLTNNHPEMKAHRQRLKMLRAEIEREIQSLIGRKLSLKALDDIRLEALRQLTGAETEILSLRASVAAAERNRASLADGMADLPERERKLASLKRDVDVAAQVYQQLLQRRSEAKLSLANNMAYSYLIEPPSLPMQPSYPQTSQALLFLLVMGLTVSFSTGLAMEFVSQIRRQGMPNAPLVSTLPLLSRQERHAGELMVRRGDCWHYLQPLKMLALSLEEKREREGKQVIAITSTSPGEGKSVTIANLACALAEMGNRVLLVDADFVHPRQHEIFSVALDQGMSELLRERLAPSKLVLELGDIDLVQSGISPVPPSLGDVKRGLGEFLESWRHAYDFVLIDLPPFLMAAEVAQVARATDGLLLLANLQKVSWSEVSEVLPQLQGVNVPVIGLVAIQAMLGHSRKGYYLIGEEGVRG